MKKRLLGVALGLAFCTNSAHALDLLHAYEAALSNDPAFRAAAKANEAAQANRVIGRAGLMPKVSANYTSLANNTTISGPGYSGGPNITYNKAYASDTAAVQLNQPLFNLEALARMRQGHAQADQGEAKFIYETQDILVRVLQAYTNVLYTLDDLSFLRAQRDAYKEQLKVNTRMYERGEGTVTDMLETKASYEMSEAKIIEAGNAVENAKRQLEALIGENLKSAEEVRKLTTDFRVVPLVPSAFEAWLDSAYVNNAELRASQHGIDIARQQYQREKAGHYPVLSGIVAWNQQRSNNVNTISQESVNSYAGVQLTIPISTGGEVTGRTSQARANLEKSMAETDGTRNKITTELRKQYDLVVTSIQKIDALYKAVSSAQELTKAMRKSVQGGQRINLDVLLADKGLATAQRDLAQAKYTYMIALLRLKQLAGDLSVEDLEKMSKNFGKDKRQG